MASQNPTTAAESKPTGLVLHHLNNSRSQRVLWLLEELEIPYTIEYHERDANMLAPKEMRNIHPLGKAPILQDGDKIIAESGTIIEYILIKYGKGRFQPLESGLIDNLYYTHYPEGTLMPILFQRLLFSILPDRSPWLIRPVTRAISSGILTSYTNPQYKANLNMVEAHLAKTPGGWFAGGEEPTSADFMMSFPLEACVHRSPELAGEKIKEWVKRVQARPAYKRGIEKGGEYDYTAKL